MVTYRIYFKSASNTCLEAELEDTKLKADFLAYLTGARLEGRAYRKASGDGELVVDFRDVCAVDIENG